MNISIKVIPHSEQRYETCGDWWFSENGDLEIRVSEMGDWRYSALVAFHELAEVLISKHRGIKTEDVDAFDVKFEEERKAGLHAKEDEPGDDENCPIVVPHSMATALERGLSVMLDVSWDKYDKAVIALDKTTPVNL